MNERAALRVRWQIARCSVLEALHDGLSAETHSLPAAVVADNYSQWLEELDHARILRVKCSYAPYCEFWLGRDILSSSAMLVGLHEPPQWRGYVLPSPQ